MKIAPSIAALCVFALAGCGTAQDEEVATLAGDWVLDAATSRVNFVTVKAGQVAEAHSFSGLSGTVGADGAASVVIDLASVETNVDIRNERMRDLLFNVAEFPEATVTTSLDPASLATLAIGESAVRMADFAINLHGMDATVPAELSITRTGEDSVAVATTAPLIINAATFGLDGGVEELRQAANLDAITGQVPVSVSLTFDRVVAQAAD